MQESTQQMTVRDALPFLSPAQRINLQYWVAEFGLKLCEFDLLEQPQRVWVEAIPRRMALAKDFDGIIWVRHIHPPQMPLSALLAWCSPRYWRWLSGVTLLTLLAAVCAFWIAKGIARRRFSLRAGIRA